MCPGVASGCGERDASSHVFTGIADTIHNPKRQEKETSGLRRPLPCHLVDWAEKRPQGRFDWKLTTSRLSRFRRSTVAQLSKALVVVGVASLFPLSASTELASPPNADAAGLTSIEFPAKGITISVSDRSLGSTSKKTPCTVYQFPRRKPYGVGNTTSETTGATTASSSLRTCDVNCPGKAKLHIRGILHSLLPVSRQPHLAKLPATFQVAVEDGQGGRQDVNFKRDIFVRKNDMVAPLKSEGLKAKETGARSFSPVSPSFPPALQAKSLECKQLTSEILSTSSKREKCSLNGEDTALWTPPKTEGSDDGFSSSIANKDTLLEAPKPRAEPLASHVFSKDTIESDVSHPTADNASTQLANATKPTEFVYTVAQLPATGALVSVQEVPMYCAVPVPGVYGHLYPVEEGALNSLSGWNSTLATNTQTSGNEPPFPPPTSSSVLPWQIITVLLGAVSGVALVVYCIFRKRRSKRYPCDQLLPNLLSCRHGIHVCDCRDCSTCAKNNACTCPCDPSVVAVEWLSSPPITREVCFELIPKLTV